MNGLGDAVGALLKAIVILLVVFVPLGLWKLIEIIIWIWSHVHFGVKP
jgi:uncharacterized membrane protein